MSAVGRLSVVEQKALAESSYKLQYRPEEKIPVIVVNNFPRMGELVGMRFLEWVQSNPEGVISLPTGKTPEFFIRWVEHTLATWNSAETQRRLGRWGVDVKTKPVLDGLHFVQIDEFYPINPSQHNSFFNYVNKYYIDPMHLRRDRALLIDCSKIGLKRGQSLESMWPDMKVDLTLRQRQPATALERKQKDMIRRIDDWCADYEKRVTALGGIGFFLGGIGPDGHIGFNCRGSAHDSITRLCETNYETQAAAAGDLGGIDTARSRLVITIGLKTISRNKDAVALIMAAGEAKSKVVADGICQKPSELYPATVLHKMPNARFYLTTGAAKDLKSRSLDLLSQQKSLSRVDIDKIVVDVSLATGKTILDLAKSDFEKREDGRLLLAGLKGSFTETKKSVHRSLVKKVHQGCRQYRKTSFLHTEPHHDDLLLGILPVLAGDTGKDVNRHCFATMTSGFNAVTNSLMISRLETLNKLMQKKDFMTEASKLKPDYDVWMYLDGLAEENRCRQDRAISLRMFRDLARVYRSSDKAVIQKRSAELVKYLTEAYPGKKDIPDVQLLKGMCREWEAECLWGLFGWKSEEIHHLRLAFYKGDIFTEEPEADRDVPPILKLMEKSNPDIISVAFDPEGSGPDTHYKVMQAINAAVDQYVKGNRARKRMKIWGYRNVWYHFHASEANVFVPVSFSMLSTMHSAFMGTFDSQKDASFPSYEYDGPFSVLAQKYQVDKYNVLKTCLGEKWFINHPSELVRSARGFVFMREMSQSEFRRQSRALRKAAENR